MSRFCIAVALVLSAYATPLSPALAHPHGWVTVDVDLITDADGKVSGVKQHWKTDPTYSVDSLDGIDKDGDGQYSASELAVLAKENMDGLVDTNFYTEAKADGKKLKFGKPSDAVITRDADKILHLTFTLPFDKPVDVAKAPLALRIFDPDFFVEFKFAADPAVRLWPNASPACATKSKPGPGDIDKADSWGGAYAETKLISCATS